MLATGGADHDIKLWTVHHADEAALPSATFVTSLSYHTAAVNVLRFTSAGDQLASGADGGEILLWKLSKSPDTINTWKLSKDLRFHVKDVLDLGWSPDGTLLVSGSVDNTVIIWDVAKGIPQQVLKDHMHYVQGVAWDPAGQHIASISGDRTCRIYSIRSQNLKSKSHEKNTFSCQNVLVKAEVPKQDDDTGASKVSAAKQNLFHDETLSSFFRRLAWSPDGSFLLVPSGVHKFSSESALSNTAFIISRKDLSRPAVQLPGASKPIVAVRFCPVIFSLQPNMEQKFDHESSVMEAFKLPYRLVFAVATLNSLFVYDTQSAYPLAVLAGLHYAPITDIAWSWDAKFMAVSSQDGFCSLVSFERGELGCPLPLNELPSHIVKFLPLAKEEVVVDQRKSVEVSSLQTDVLSESIRSENKAGIDSVNLPESGKEGICIEPFVAVQPPGIEAETISESLANSALTILDPIVSNAHDSTMAQVRPGKLRRITPTAIPVDSTASPLQPAEGSMSVAK